MRRIFDHIHNKLLSAKQYRTALIVSLCNALVLSICVYILNNQSLFTGEDLNHYVWMQMLKNKLGRESGTINDSVLFINVAYDKQLIELNDEFDMPIGNIDITDRKKLLTFFQILHTTNKYAYIFLDIRFEKGYEVPEVDSLLFSEIRDMDNIVVANHLDMELADSTLRQKTAISDYDATIIATNFIRYKYSYDGEPSMPLYVYRAQTGNDIMRHGFIYTCDNKLCYNSLFVDFPIESFSEYDANNRKTYYNLGSDLLNNYSKQDIEELTRNKYIVIGDMIEDLHDTYAGQKPGSIITYYAFQSLMENKHYVKYWLIMLMALVYFVISLTQFGDRSIEKRIPFVRKSKSKLLHFLFSLIEYTFLLSVVVIVLDLFWGISTSIILPSTYFALQKHIITYKRTKL